MPQLQSIVKVNQNFQITIPAVIRKKYAIGEGDLVKVVDTNKGISIKPKLLLDTLPEVELSKNGEKMLEEALNDIKAGRYKQFHNVGDLIRDLHNDN